MIEAANPGQALAAVLVDELARLGMRDAVLAPGSRSTPLALALHADPRVRLHVRLDERSAAYTALGMARATTTPVAVVTTSGTAAAILHPAVLEADAARVPLLALTADRPPELRGAGANQTVDQLGLFGRAPRWFCEVGVPEALPGANAYWRSVACRAWSEATGVGGPAGPVHLNLAFRDPLVPEGPGFGHPLDGRPHGRPWTAPASGRRLLDDEELDALARRLGAAARGVIVVGDTRAEVAEALPALAEAVGWPLLVEPMSGARSGPCAVSTYDALLRSPGFAEAHRPDLALVVGRVALSRALGAWLGSDVPRILLDEDAAWLDPERAATDVLASEAAATASALAARLPAPRETGWLGSWQRSEERARRALDTLLDAETAPSEPRLARDLAAALPEGALLAVASSMPVRDLAATMAPRRGLRVIGNRGASGIDGFCSTVLGAALVHPGPVAGLSGDLSLLHDASGLLTPGGPRPDVALVVVNNDGGGIFSFLPQARLADGFERLFGTPHGVDVERVAATYGCGYERLERADGLSAALGAARRAGGVRIVEARTDRTANAALHERMHAAVREAVES